MATHLSYSHANLGYVTVAEIVKHSRPVLVVDIKRTTGSVKRTLRIRFQLNRAIKHIRFEILYCNISRFNTAYKVFCKFVSSCKVNVQNVDGMTTVVIVVLVYRSKAASRVAPNILSQSIVIINIVYTISRCVMCVDQ